ncbi:MAG: hypothetical protein JWP38_1361 [Herbaspirillum sp.]|jgi:hypothetical protein|nr:hypothetical protein [Herbaspirillum sp.]
MDGTRCPSSVYSAYVRGGLAGACSLWSEVSSNWRGGMGGTLGGLEPAVCICILPFVESCSDGIGGRGRFLRSCTGLGVFGGRGGSAGGGRAPSLVVSMDSLFLAVFWLLSMLAYTTSGFPFFSGFPPSIDAWETVCGLGASRGRLPGCDTESFSPARFEFARGAAIGPESRVATLFRGGTGGRDMLLFLPSKKPINPRTDEVGLSPTRLAGEILSNVGAGRIEDWIFIYSFEIKISVRIASHRRLTPAEYDVALALANAALPILPGGTDAAITAIVSKPFKGRL